MDQDRRDMIAEWFAMALDESMFDTMASCGSVRLKHVLPDGTKVRVHVDEPTPTSKKRAERLAKQKGRRCPRD